MTVAPRKPHAPAATARQARDTIRASIKALQKGYAAEKSMFDDDMIEHAQTICGQHIDELARLLGA